MAQIEKRKNVKAQGAYFVPFQSNNTSQHGEDGVLAELFRLLPLPEHPYCIDVGAWDGKHLSNTYSLLNGLESSYSNRTGIANKNKDQSSSNSDHSLKSTPSTARRWGGLLFEADTERCGQMQDLYKDRSDVICENVIVDLEGENSLSSLVSKYKMTEVDNIDFVSIDIDGGDYHMWKEFSTRFSPSVVCIEFNPTIPANILFIQEPDVRVQQGCSLLALVDLATSIGYSLVATTMFNGIFVRNDLMCHIPEYDRDISTLHDPAMCTELFQTYDGELKIVGTKKLLWHKLPINPQKLQILSKKDRVFPFAPERLPIIHILDSACATVYGIVSRIRKTTAANSSYASSSASNNASSSTTSNRNRNSSEVVIIASLLTDLFAALRKVLSQCYEMLPVKAFEGLVVEQLRYLLAVVDTLPAAAIDSVTAPTASTSSSGSSSSSGAVRSVQQICKLCCWVVVQLHLSVCVLFESRGDTIANSGKKKNNSTSSGLVNSEAYDWYVNAVGSLSLSFLMTEGGSTVSSFISSLLTSAATTATSTTTASSKLATGGTSGNNSTSNSSNISSWSLDSMLYQDVAVSATADTSSCRVNTAQMYLRLVLKIAKQCRSVEKAQEQNYWLSCAHKRLREIAHQLREGETTTTTTAAGGGGGGAITAGITLSSKSSKQQQQPPSSLLQVSAVCVEELQVLQYTFDKELQKQQIGNLKGAAELQSERLRQHFTSETLLLDFTSTSSSSSSSLASPSPSSCAASPAASSSAAVSQLLLDKFMCAPSSESNVKRFAKTVDPDDKSLSLSLKHLLAFVPLASSVATAAATAGGGGALASALPAGLASNSSMHNNKVPLSRLRTRGGDNVSPSLLSQQQPELVQQTHPAIATTTTTRATTVPLSPTTASVSPAGKTAASPSSTSGGSPVAATGVVSSGETGGEIDCSVAVDSNDQSTQSNSNSNGNGLGVGGGGGGSVKERYERAQQLQKQTEGQRMEALKKDPSRSITIETPMELRRRSFHNPNATAEEYANTLTPAAAAAASASTQSGKRPSFTTGAFSSSSSSSYSSTRLRTASTDSGWNVDKSGNYVDTTTTTTTIGSSMSSGASSRGSFVSLSPDSATAAASSSSSANNNNSNYSTTYGGIATITDNDDHDDAWFADIPHVAASDNGNDDHDDDDCDVENTFLFDDNRQFFTPPSTPSASGTTGAAAAAAAADSGDSSKGGNVGKSSLSLVDSGTQVTPVVTPISGDSVGATGVGSVSSIFSSGGGDGVAPVIRSNVAETLDDQQLKDVQQQSQSSSTAAAVVKEEVPVEEEEEEEVVPKALYDAAIAECAALRKDNEELVIKVKTAVHELKAVREQKKQEELKLKQQQQQQQQAEEDEQNKNEAAAKRETGGVTGVAKVSIINDDTQQEVISAATFPCPTTSTTSTASTATTTDPFPSQTHGEEGGSSTLLKSSLAVSILLNIGCIAALVLVNAKKK